MEEHRCNVLIEDACKRYGVVMEVLPKIWERFGWEFGMIEIDEGKN